jgi:hypothetical protein
MEGGSAGWEGPQRGGTSILNQQRGGGSSYHARDGGVNWSGGARGGRPVGRSTK